MDELFTDEGLRQLWLFAGGQFHGPNVETGTMPEDKLLPFLRLLAASPSQPERQKVWVLWNTHDDEAVMIYTEKPSESFKAKFELREATLNFAAAPALGEGER